MTPSKRARFCLIVWLFSGVWTPAFSKPFQQSEDMRPPIRPIPAPDFPRCSLSEEWTTVDSFSPGGGWASSPQGIAGGRNASFVVGAAQHPLRFEPWSRWHVRRSRDGGRTWQGVDSFALDEGKKYLARAVTVSPTTQHVFVGGGENVFEVRPEHRRWIIRKSTDNGTSWSTIYNSGFRDYLSALGSDRNGVVYAAGGQSFGSEPVLRRSTNGGTTWQNISLGAEILSEMQAISAMAVTPDGQVILAGPRTLEQIFPLPHVVVHSPNGRDGWRIVHRLPTMDFVQLAVSERGQVAITGRRPNPASGRSQWLTISSRMPDFTFWTTIDVFSAAGESIGRGATYARDNTLHLTGVGDLPSTRGVFTRTTRLGEFNFSTSDFLAVPRFGSEGLFVPWVPITTLPQGHLLYSTEIPFSRNADGSLNSRWVTRRQECE